MRCISGHQSSVTTKTHPLVSIIMQMPCARKLHVGGLVHAVLGCSLVPQLEAGHNDTNKITLSQDASETDWGEKLIG